MSVYHGNPVQMLYSGIFSDERVLQLLHILQSMSEHCFSKLHEVSNEGRPSSTEYALRFRKGLDSIEYWKTEVKTEETRLALHQYPELGALYKYAIVCYLKELYKNERAERIPVSIPPLQDFLHSYYVALSKTSYMQKLEFLNVYGLERTHMHMEALRSTLMEFTRHSVHRTPVIDIPFAVTSTPAIRGLVSVEKDITPGDSVSQRGDHPYEDAIIRHPSTPPKNSSRTTSRPLSKTGNKPLDPRKMSSEDSSDPRKMSSEDSSDPRKMSSEDSSDPRTGRSPITFSDPTPVSIYDKATETYYKAGKNRNGEDPTTRTNSVPSPPSDLGDDNDNGPSTPVQQTQPSSRPLHIEKEESESDTSSRSSSSDSSDKFSHKPVFPPTKNKDLTSHRKTSSSKVSSAQGGKSSTSSAHTIRVNLPNRPLPDLPPSPLKKSNKSRFF